MDDKICAVPAVPGSLVLVRVGVIGIRKCEHMGTALRPVRTTLWLYGSSGPAVVRLYYGMSYSQEA